MTMINLVTYDLSFRTAVNTVLKKYFDGANHNFNATPVAFPSCDIAFDRKQLGESIPRPLIMVEKFGDVNRFRQSEQTGLRRQFVQQCFVRVYTSDPNDVWKSNNNVQNLLGLVFASAADEFADLGVKPVGTTEPVPIPFDPAHRMQVTQRVVRLRIDGIYPRKG